MTVLFLVRLFYPHVGGVEKHVFELSKRLVRDGQKVIIIAEDLPKSHSDYSQSGDLSTKIMEELQGIEIYRIPLSSDFQEGSAAEKRKKFLIWAWLWRHQNLIASADIIHCHDVFFWYLPFRFLYPQKPVYITFHGFEGKCPPAKKAIFVRKISEKLSWGNICVGDFIKKWYGTNPNFVVYGGVTLEGKNKPNEKERKNNKTKIVFIGRLEKDTGILNYLEVLKFLKRKNIAFTFEAFGDGRLRNVTESFGKVYGFVQNLNDYIQTGDIFFTSSYLSLLELLTNKKFVIAMYDNPLKEDYLKMSPFAKWITIESSPQKVSKAIASFLKYPTTRAKVIEQGYEWARKQTWDNVVEKYISLWHV